MEPAFEDARFHDPAAIALLCGGCHDAVTRGMRSRASIVQARANPFCMSAGESRFALDLTKPALTVRFAGVRFVNTPLILQIMDQPILTIEPPEVPGAPPRLSASFYDRNSTLVARIDRNEWKGLTTAFDIEAKGRSWKIRSAIGDIDLVLMVEPPSGVAIERLRLHYAGCAVESTSDGGFKASTKRASLECRPRMVDKVERAPMGVVLDESGVRFGTDVPLMLQIPGQRLGPGALQVASGPVRFVNATDVDPSSLHPPGKRLLEVTGDATIHINVPFGTRPAPPVTSSLPGRPPSPSRPRDAGAQPGTLSSPPGKTGPKPARNAPCSCGSGRKFKHCCGR